MRKAFLGPLLGVAIILVGLLVSYLISSNITLQSSKFSEQYQLIKIQQYSSFVSGVLESYLGYLFSVPFYYIMANSLFYGGYYISTLYLEAY